jgi:SAM-dependent methyltransferase
MVDWAAGSYETTSGIELAPVADVVVDAAGVTAADTVVDVACGTGNAALAAARRGARVIGVDGAPRLLDVAAERARAAGIELDLRAGDLHALPVADGSVDIAVSVFGVIYAADPSAALAEIRRALDPAGRLVVSAWVPDGPIDAMLGAIGRIVARITGSPPGPRFAWHDASALAPPAAQAGLVLEQTTAHRLAIRAPSAEAYVETSQDHPMAVAILPAVRAAGAEDELREAQLAVLRAANEDPDGFLVHTPYVVHRLRAAPPG